MIVFDTEVTRFNWILSWLDTKTKKTYSINDSIDLLKKFYEHYKNEIWIGYNSRNYDIWIIKALLCGFTAWEMNDWIINKDRKGYEFSRLLNKFPILSYDCSVGFRSLKELEAFQGHSIVETSVSFNIDRPLTKEEILSMKKYCENDVMETFGVFVETKEEFESHIGLIKEFNLPIENINKTKAQLSAIILGANKRVWDDEFVLDLPDNMVLGKYDFIRQHFLNWAKYEQNYDSIGLECDIAGVPHKFGVGGVHGSADGYYGEGWYLMADVASYYPASMILYNYLSRNVSNPKKYKEIRDERIRLKALKDPRQNPRKIVLNATFGASKDKYNNLYDPKQANCLCIANQLFLIDLIEKLEGKCELIQSNTDGILLKLFKLEDKDLIIEICHEWEKRTGFELEFDMYRRVIQSNVNNYIIVPDGELYDSKGKERFKRKGAIVKKLSPIDNDLPIVNKAVVNYFLYGTPVEETILDSKNRLIDFQKITKISGKYEYGFKEYNGGKYTSFVNPENQFETRSYFGEFVYEKVHRCFASLDRKDGSLYKKNKTKWTIDKTPSTPENCFIINEDILEMSIPTKLDKQWYINEAKQRIEDFLKK